MAVVITTYIKAPASLVFEYLRNLDKVRMWVNEVEEARLTYEPKDKAEGTLFMQKIRQGFSLNEYQGEVIGFEQDRFLKVRLLNESATMETSYTLEPDEKGCTITYSTELSARNIRGSFLGLMFRGFSEGVLRRQLMTLKRLTEKEYRSAI
jgi:uncharacterized protein YndB with AHSA1/START domain